MRHAYSLWICVGGLVMLAYADDHPHCGGVPYDPNTQGCCRKADGTEDITDIPDNPEDPCSLLGQAPPAQGANICVNGKPFPCVFPQNFPEGWPTDVATECLQDHEDYHAKNHPNDCDKDCTVRPANHKYPDDMELNEKEEEYKQRKCEAFVPLMDCINKHALPDDDPFRDNVQRRWDSYKCDERLGP